MNIKEYKLENWAELLDKDWDYLRQDNGSGNVERIIDHLFASQKQEIIEMIEKNAVEVDYGGFVQAVLLDTILNQLK